MCSELTKDAYEADTHQPLSPSEIAALPVRKTWYGIAGTHPEFLVPANLTDDAQLAKARCFVKNSEAPTLGPWRVVVLTENLRAQV